MRLLLDTRVFLWSIGNPEELREAARTAIVDPDNDVAVSAVSVWEVAIKRSLGKLNAPIDIVQAIADTRFRPLSITLEHAAGAGALPRHHGDPFDRMLVAQAQHETLTLVTRDSHLAAYGVPLLAA